MDPSDAPPAPPWHKRVLDWLGVESCDGAEAAAPLALPDPGERFSWEPAPPAPRPPQWGAADQPELLLGLEHPADAGPALGPVPHAAA